MSQHDMNLANDTGANFRADANNALAALVSQSSGASAPSTTYAYQRWVDTTSGLMKRRNAANSGWVLDAPLAEAFLVGKSSNYTALLADYGVTFLCTSTFTLALTAAATLGDGWFCEVRNDGSGVITIDPNSSEQIDGATTLTLQPGESCVVRGNASAFKTIGSGRLAVQKPAFSAYSTVGTSIAVTTFTKLGWNAEDFDITAAFDATTNYRFTPQVPGRYQVNILATIATLATTYLWAVSLYKNGLQIKQALAFNSTGSTVELSVSSAYLVELNGSTDYIEVFGYHTDPTTRALSTTAAKNHFSAALVS